MKCVNHPEKDAVSVCVACGKGLCHDCRKVVRGAGYCEECAATHEPMRVFPGRAGDGLNVWAVAAWVLAMAGLWPGLEFVAIAGIVLGFVALGDLSLRNIQQSGRSYAYAAIAFGVGGLLIKLGFVAYLLWNGIVESPFDAYRYLSTRL